MPLHHSSNGGGIKMPFYIQKLRFIQQSNERAGFITNIKTYNRKNILVKTKCKYNNKHVIEKSTFLPKNLYHFSIRKL